MYLVHMTLYIWIDFNEKKHSKRSRKNRSTNNMSQAELTALQAILTLIRAVATHDDIARIALSKHSNWPPLHNLLGLVSCSIDRSLKTDLLLTLAAFGKSKETALELWENLESSQIITTIQSTNALSTVTNDIESEIDQTKSSNAAYPLTQAILELLYTLSTTIVPRNLGGGSRKPGIKPYFNFIVDVIFLKYDRYGIKQFYYVFHRYFINTLHILLHIYRIYNAQKWTVAEKCLKIFDFFIKIYEIDSTDFARMGQNEDEYAQPGFYVLLKMNTNETSEFLK